MTSGDTAGRPSGWRLFHLQYRRNPCRCQAITVSGWTITRRIASRSRIGRAIPIGIDPRDSSAADGHGGSAGGPRADGGGQESQLATLREFERLAEKKKTARGSSRACRRKSYSDGYLNSTSSVRTEFLVGAT